MKDLKQFFNKPFMGPIFIMIAAALWAVDPVIRVDLNSSMPAAAIVFYEHLIGFIVLAPFLYLGWDQIKKLTTKDWLLIVLMAGLSSVLGGYLFTEALARGFEVFDFVSPILLQKLQPIFVIGLSALFLHEKISWKFVMMLPIVLIASYMVDFGADAISLEFGTKQTIYLLSIGAAFAWGAGTILSKYALTKLKFEQAAALRFLLAIPISLILSISIDQTYAPADLNIDQVLNFILIALTTGAGAIALYYMGLKRTEAKVATIAELTFPIVTLLIGLTTLNPYGDPQQLPLVKAFGVVILIISILVISFDAIERKQSKK